MSNVDTSMRDALSELKKARDKSRGNDSGGGGDHTGGNPPGGEGLEKRVEKLEGTVHDVQLRLVRIDTHLEYLKDNMAKHSDISDLKTMMAELEARMIRWFVGTAFAMTGLAATISFGLAKLIS